MIRSLYKSSETSLHQRVKGLEQWLETDSGNTLVDAQKSLLDKELGTSFGFHAGQCSISWRLDLLSSSPVRRQFILNYERLENPPRPYIQADFSYWPVTPGSMDLVLIQHTLEVAESPHRLLSEAANTVMPGGKLIILGFNPYSLANTARYVVPSYRKMLRGVHFISPSRMKDWLVLLNFSIEKVMYSGYLHPVKHWFSGLKGDLIENRLKQAHVPVGGFYLMIARRDTPGLTPIRKVWSDVRRRFVGQPLVRPSAGRISNKVHIKKNTSVCTK
ncbi:MAG: class I SAM-dependent methyltransferase [Endozoicomonas sp.]